MYVVHHCHLERASSYRFESTRVGKHNHHNTDTSHTSSKSIYEYMTWMVVRIHSSKHFYNHTHTRIHKLLMLRALSLMSIAPSFYIYAAAQTSHDHDDLSGCAISKRFCTKSGIWDRVSLDWFWFLFFANILWNYITYIA